MPVNDSIAKEASVGRMCDPKDWVSCVDRAKGTSETALTLNSYLDAIDRQVDNSYQSLKMAIEISAAAVINKYLGKEEKPKLLMEIFADQNRKMETSIGKDFKVNTLKGYKSSVSLLAKGWVKKNF